MEQANLKWINAPPGKARTLPLKENTRSTFAIKDGRVVHARPAYSIPGPRLVMPKIQ